MGVSDRLSGANVGGISRGDWLSRANSGVGPRTSWRRQRLSDGRTPISTLKGSSGILRGLVTKGIVRAGATAVRSVYEPNRLPAPADMDRATALCGASQLPETAATFSGSRAAESSTRYQSAYAGVPP